MSRPLAGILVHPWDLKDEGPSSVAEILHDAGITSVFVAVNASAEEHPPQPIDGRLTHNPKRKRYVSEEGRFYYEIDPSYYVNSVAPPKRTSDKDLMGFDALNESQVFLEKGISVYAWLSTFHNGQFVKDAQELAAVDMTNRADRNWMCPANPNSLIQVLELVNEIQSRYGFLQGILLDKFWWKYPHTYMPTLESGMVCFCEHCLGAMESSGINPRELRRALSEIASSVRRLDAGTLEKVASVDLTPLLDICGLPAREGAGYADVMNALFENPSLRRRLPDLSEADPLGIFRWISKHPVLLDWFDVRSKILQRDLEAIRTLVKQNDPTFEVGLGIWSPRSSWSVCQRYTDLLEHSDWLMPMVYHRIWGWYSSCVAEELFEITHPRTPRIFASYKSILRSWYKLAGYSGSHLRSNIVNGLPLSQIEKELSRVRDLVGGRRPVYAGVQVWEPGSKIPHPQEAAETIRIGLDSSEGVIIQAYGWAPMPNLVAAGKVLNSLSQTRP